MMDPPTILDPMTGFDDGDFSIDVDYIFDILENDQFADPLQSLGTSQGFNNDVVVPGRIDHTSFKPKAEPSSSQGEFRGEHSQWNFSPSVCERKIQSDYRVETRADFSDFSGNGGSSSSQQVYSIGFNPSPLKRSSNWYMMNAPGGSSGSLFTNNYDHRHMLNNVQEYGMHNMNAIGPTSQNIDCAFPFISKEQTKTHQLYFRSEEESKPVVNIPSSYSSMQTRGSSHRVSSENSFLFSGSGVSATDTLPFSAMEDKNQYPSHLMYSHMSDTCSTDQVPLEANTCQLTNMTFDGSNDFNGLSEYPDDVTFSFDELEAMDAQHMPCGYESIDRKESQLEFQNSYRTSERTLGVQEGLQDSNIGLDASLRDEPNTDDESSENLSLISEYSTDSSPISSSRKIGYGSADSCGVNSPETLLSNPKVVSPCKHAKVEIKNDRGNRLHVSRCKQDICKDASPVVQKNTSNGNLGVDDDSDVRILDHISDPATPARLPLRRKPNSISRYSGSGKPRSGIGGTKLKSNDERSLRIALQDMSQPITEASPPEGVLAVSLLRHQRMALSWMVHKETVSIHCSGGILADDQGLGKTISTIALILTERSPSKVPSVLEKRNGCKSLSLEEYHGNQIEVNIKASDVVTPIKKANSFALVGRPQGGTLVVCPTSVLRQWADELHNKVASEANLSCLVYHGGNRTKDASELAKYDVVLTTYAIVSMEVPKQPLVDKDDEDKMTDSKSNSKKRKISNSKVRNGASPESSLRPLARVGWFRVVLDEAQSIKNHKTQAARACWGLRAKRRWCLSGTPIQNAIDDLYSYFRFLRFDPFETYSFFCSSIKGPISKNSPKGYKLLQAVLKMIMLRRTKATLLDGKPIINLPPKTVSLKKVKFSNEERTFYATLEAESQEQFKVYADAGTVKQNYVNILLMLLRLRQACNHRLLVKGYDSDSNWNSPLEVSKKLPKDKRIHLLSCLGGSFCIICNDAPEDPVVTLCGHVFCKQCIFEHLTGDEKACPSPSCKVQLSVAQVFSRGTLKSSLNDQNDPDIKVKDEHTVSDNSSLAFVQSSKINAALEILQSLPKYQVTPKKSKEKSDVRSQNCLLDSSDTNMLSSSLVSEKAIVFSQWTGMLDLLETPLKASSIKYRRLDGTMSVTARERAIKDFNTLPEVTVMIMSLKAASLGLNLVVASHVLLLDLWWNPTTEDQAIDRAHRIGQTRPVSVSRITVEHTVEDRILGLQQMKREMVSSAFGEDESGTRQTRLTEEDLRYLLKVT